MADWSKSTNQRITEAYLDFCNKQNPAGEGCPYPLDAFLIHCAELLGAINCVVMSDDRQFQILADIDPKAAERWPVPR